MTYKPLFDAFKNESLDVFSEVIYGLKTGDNDRFLRFWFEVYYSKIDLNFYPKENNNTFKKWFPLNKAGEFRKWYGNQEYIINWLNDGEAIKNFSKSGVVNTSYYFKELICWTRITVGDISFRYFPRGFIPDQSAGLIFFEKDFEYLISFLNSSISRKFVKILSPTLNYNISEISKIPIIKNNDYDKEIII